MMLLNPGYETPNSPVYEYEGSLYYNAKSGTCYDGRTVSCDFTDTGLQSSEEKEMIEEAVWNLGELSTSSSGDDNYETAFASTWYAYERSTEVSSDSANWTGKIGLMYASDYGFATSGGNTTNRETCLNTALYNWDSVSDCFNNDWLYDSSGWQWTLNASSTASYVVFFVTSDGKVYYNDTNPYYMISTGVYVFPTLYLSSNVKISDGEGSKENPYQLSL